MAPRARSPNPLLARGRQDGLSLIETLIASGLLLVIALGLAPLFSRAITTNTHANSYTEASNSARSALEGYFQLDFNAPELTLPPGETILETREYLHPDQGTWVAFDQPGDIATGALWIRTIQIQQFSIADLMDNGRLDEPLDGDEIAERVQLKRIRVNVRSRWGDRSALVAPVNVTIDGLKSV
jgi:type II secretory pathway pseudopilin PulG